MIKSILTVLQVLNCKTPIETFSAFEGTEELRGLVLTEKTEAAEALLKITGFTKQLDYNIKELRGSSTPIVELHLPDDVRNSSVCKSLVSDKSLFPVNLNDLLSGFPVDALDGNVFIIPINNFSFNGSVLRGTFVDKYGVTRDICKLVYTNGNSYWGEVHGGKRSGYGKVYMKDGSRVEGLFIDDLLNGFGVYIHFNKSRYYGNFKDSTYDGIGYYECSNGTQYFGLWSNGFRHGRGIQKNSDESIYVGDYSMGVYEGEGIYRWADGALYTGAFLNGAQHGQGRFDCPDKIRYYEGAWVEGKKEGRGTIGYENRSRYEGEFVNDKEDGTGYLISPDGSRKKVYFKHGKRVYPDVVRIRKVRIRSGKFFLNPRRYRLGRRRRSPRPQ